MLNAPARPDRSARTAVQEDVWIPSACSTCYGGCAILVHRVNGVVVKIEGNPASPNGSGRLCPKGVAGIMLLYDPHRVNTPLKRTNPEKGIGVDPGFVPISWEEALSLITERLAKIRADDPRKLIFQATTTAANSKTIGAIAFSAAFGTSNVTHAGGGLHCGNGAHFLSGLFHSSWSLVPDYELCQYALYFGASKGHGAGHVANPVAQQAADARARGMRLVVVDPMLNFASAKASEWVPIRVGTDAALALAMVNLLLNEYGIYDAPYLARHTNGPYLVGPDRHYVRDAASGKPLVWDTAAGQARPFDAQDVGEMALLGDFTVNGVACAPAFQRLKDHVRTYTPEYAERITTIPAQDVRRLAREFGEAARIGSTIVLDGVELPYRPAAAIFFRGAQGHKNSVYNCLAIELLNQIVGAADVPGGALGFNPVCFGQPDSGRPAYVPRPDADGLMLVGSWNTLHPPYPLSRPRAPTSLTLKDMFPGCLSSPFLASSDQEKLWTLFDIPYRPEAMINFGANSIMSVGNAETVAESLRKIPFIASFDLFLTEFTDFADVVLPDASYLERMDPQPNFPFIFSHNPGRGRWGWSLRQPVVEPIAERRDFNEVMLEIAERLGMREEMNGMINLSFQLQAPYRLEPETAATWQEVCDRMLKSHFGAERGVEWFKQEGQISWPKQVKEVYWRPFVPVRVPIYPEFLQTTGEQLASVLKNYDLKVDLSRYSPLPDWTPCPAHEAQDPAFDLYAFYYRDTLHSNSMTMENPWLDEMARTNRYSYAVALNAATGRAKGLNDGDIVRVDSLAGRTVEGPVWLTEGIHPEGLGIAACAGHWSRQQPTARGKGVFFNALLEVDMAHVDPVNLNLDLCARVRVSKMDSARPS